MLTKTDFLFPNPSSPPSTLSPYHWPGVSPESTQALRDVLKDNHERWHIFFNDKGFHNHTAHRALAIWALGADGAVIRAAYQHDSKEQRPAFRSPKPITTDNFEDHLGDEKYFHSYLEFFNDYVQKEGMDKALETFIFSRKFNIGNKKPQMLNRFLSGLVHSMIHTGYGAEFALPGTLIEGLAQTCVHRADVSKLLPVSFFESAYMMSDTTPSKASKFMTNATRKLEQVASHLSPISTAASTIQDKPNVHALTILARVMEDSRLIRPENLDQLAVLQGTIEMHADLIRDYASQWTISLQKPFETDRKFEELVWMNTVMYGVAGWTWAQQERKGEDGEFNADFFLVHLVTSAAFIPSLLARLRDAPHAQVLLLRSYFTVCLSWYIARGRPKFDVRAFYASPSATPYPLPIHSLPTPHKDALPGQDKPQSRVPDPWLPLVQTTVVHPDEHLAKAVRSLAAWASKFGKTPAGTFKGPSHQSTGSADAIQADTVTNPTLEGGIGTELPGAEYLDGTLFIRVAGLTVARLGRVGQGEAPAEFWDYAGFYKGVSEGLGRSRPY